MEHGDYDHYWQAQDVPQHLRKTSVSVKESFVNRVAECGVLSAGQEALAS
jgi:hypothetical protein